MKTFYWCTGQDDNIGDIVLRRRYADELRKLGDLHIYVGSASPSFIAGMGFDVSDTQYTSAVLWLKQMLVPRVARRTLLAFNPGELQVGRKSAISTLVILPVQLWLRAWGGRCVRIGLATRGSHKLYEIPIRLSNALCDSVVWRDTESRKKWRVGQPGLDWAFDETMTSIGTSSGRTKLALTMRSDRPELSEDALKAISEVARRRGLNLVVFSQVKRDRAACQQLSKRLQCELLDWDERVGHLEQEALVRQLASESVAILSDRIHALIIGATEGAIPVGIVLSEDTKVRPHFDAAGLSRVSTDIRKMGYGDVLTFIEGVLARGPEISRKAIEARELVREMASTLVVALPIAARK